MMVHLLAVLAGATILAGCVGVVPSGGRAAPEPGEVQFELAGPGGAALVVPVTVNGEGPFPFILDTGATLTCVDEALVKELDLGEVQGVTGLGGTIQGMGRMRLISLGTVALGEATVHELRGCAVDLSPMRQAGLEVQGLLGLNFLRAYRMTLDFAGKTVRLESPSGAPADGS